MNDLERYIDQHITPEDPLLTALDRETHMRVIQPRMISGHLQGKLLEMLVRMLAPKRILEIGTFTGYSAICMAKGLDKGGELHTIEIDDELEDIAAKYFQAAEPRRRYTPRYRPKVPSAFPLSVRFGSKAHSSGLMSKLKSSFIRSKLGFMQGSPTASCFAHRFWKRSTSEAKRLRLAGLSSNPRLLLS